MDVVCQIYQEKAGGFLLDDLTELAKDDGPKARWLTTTLVSLGPSLERILSRRLLEAPDHALPRLLDLAAMSANKHLAIAVEELVDHRKNDIRLKAVNTLGQLHAERSVPRLAQIMVQKSLIKSKKMKSLQLATARALAEIGTEEARAALLEAANQGSGELQALCQELV